MINYKVGVRSCHAPLIKVYGGRNENIQHSNEKKGRIRTD